MQTSKRQIPLLSRLHRRLSRVTSSGRYIAEIDGLRFAAIFPVVVQHLSERLLRHGPAAWAESAETSSAAFFAGRGTIGVFLFFAISGFILGLPFAKRYRAGRPAPAIRPYLWRRVTRLEPPYIFWMTGFALVLLLQGALPAGDLLPRLGASLIYQHNWIYNGYSPINPVAWSLEVEIQFYLLAPFLGWLFFGLFRAPYRKPALLLAVILTLAAQQLFGWKTMPWKASLAGQLQHFLLGFLLVDYFLDRRLGRRGAGQYTWDVLGLAGLALMPFTWSDEFFKELLFALGLVLFFVGAFRGRLLSRWLGNRWIAVIGGMCYTIYLIHLPLLELLTRQTAGWIISDQYFWQLLWQLVLIGPVVVVVSAVAFVLTEKPFMNPDWPAQFSAFIRAALGRAKSIRPSRTSLVILALILGGGAFAQSADSTAQRPAYHLPPDLSRLYEDSEDFNMLRLQPLPAMISAALKYSPLLKVQDRQIESAVNEMLLLRRQWLDNIFLGGSFSFGNGLFFDATQTDAENTAKLVNRRNALYNLGMTVRIPVGTFIKRPAEVKIAENEIEIALLRRREIELEIRRKVIEYYSLLTHQVRILRIRAESKENAAMAATVAEEFFQQGAMDVGLYNQELTKKTRAEEDFERARYELVLNLLMLREIVGTDIMIDQAVKKPTR